MHEHFVALTTPWHPQAALSSRELVAMVAVAYVQRPLFKARAHASRAQAATQYAVVIFAATARHCDQLSLQSCQGCSGIVASTVAARLCQHGKTCSLHIPPNQATPRRLHFG